MPCKCNRHVRQARLQRISQVDSTWAIIYQSLTIPLRRHFKSNDAFSSKSSPTVPVLRKRHSDLPEQAHQSNHTLDLERLHPTDVLFTGQGRILYIPNLRDQGFRLLGCLLSPLSKTHGATLQPLLSAAAKFGWCGPQALYWAYMPADRDRSPAGLRKG